MILLAYMGCGIWASHLPCQPMMPWHIDSQRFENLLCRVACMHIPDRVSRTLGLPATKLGATLSARAALGNGIAWENLFQPGPVSRLPCS